MANTVQAKKRVRQNKKQRQHNASLRSMYRTYVKKVEAEIESKNKEAADAAYKKAVPVIDSMVNKGIIHKNKAARNKSRLSKRIKDM